MSRMKCPDCGKTHSDQAEACPKCGRQVKQKSLFTKELGVDGTVCGLMIVAGMCLAAYGWPSGLLLIVVGVVLLLIVLIKR